MLDAPACTARRPAGGSALLGQVPAGHSAIKLTRDTFKAGRSDPYRRLECSQARCR
jgi:hypothetical protein